MPFVFFDEGGELVFGTLLFVGGLDALDAGFGFLDGAASVVFAEVEVEGAGSGEGGDLGGVAVLVPTGDEVGEAVEEVFFVDAFVSGEAAVADEGFEAGFPGADEPGVGGAHGVAVTSEVVGLDFGAGDEEVDSAAHIQNVLPGHGFAGDDVAEEFVSFVPDAFEFAGGVLAFFEAEGVGA